MLLESFTFRKDENDHSKLKDWLVMGDPALIYSYQRLGQMKFLHQVHALKEYPVI